MFDNIAIQSGTEIGDVHYLDYVGFGHIHNARNNYDDAQSLLAHKLN